MITSDKESLFGEKFSVGSTLKVHYDKYKNPVFIISTEKDNEDEIEQIFQFYRNNGYPDYRKEEYDICKEYLSVKSSDNPIIGKDIQQSMAGCGFLWTYFPNWKDIECGNSKSLSDLWKDDNKLRELIRKTYRWQQKYGNGIFTVNRLRQNAKVYLCGQSVSNFRPTVAKYIYDTYGNRGSVWDMSCGFGGRLLGFFTSNCKEYYGTDPSTSVMNGLNNLYKDLQQIDKDKKVYLFKQGSEINVPMKDKSIDLCFTSPPYFDTEKYSDEETQSYLKYKTEDAWINGFLNDTIKNCYRVLKDGGYLIINIANVQTAKDLEERAVEIIKKNNFELEDTLYMVLSSISGKGIKKEPIFVFRKRN